LEIKILERGTEVILGPSEVGGVGFGEFNRFGPFGVFHGELRQGLARQIEQTVNQRRPLLFSPRRTSADS